MSAVGKPGIVAAAIAAVLFLAGALVLDGYMTASRQVAAADPTPTRWASTPLAPQTVYVLPASLPQVVHVTRTEPPAAPPVVHVVVPAGGDEGHEGGDDD